MLKGGFGKVEGISVRERWHLRGKSGCVGEEEDDSKAWLCRWGVCLKGRMGEV
ncbi:hypothetical protein [Bartonella sp. WD16.2]|uniref:hypothetical protein n=1 Tax=Bartonella sp. WD16.2 TaxID=1933904 RepID=UPI00129467E7|nr:hypothetical protein [Bartonella sp. WD16.2]